MDWKKLLMPNISKISVLVMLVLLFLTNIQGNDGFQTGFPFTFYGGGYGKYYHTYFSISYFLIDILIWYTLLCIAYYHQFLKTDEDFSFTKKTLFNMGNFIIGFIIFVIIFFAFLVIEHDVFEMIIIKKIFG